MLKNLRKLFEYDSPEPAPPTTEELFPDIVPEPEPVAHDTEDLCGDDIGRGYNMTTASGHPFWPGDPRAEDVQIDAIVIHLSRLTRFNGALKDGVWRAHDGYSHGEARFFNSQSEAMAAGYRYGTWIAFELFSVAQHSSNVCDHVTEPHLKLPALLHDAAEAYLGDMIKPIKNLHPGRKKLERDIDVAIAKRFGFDVELFDHPSIKRADYEAVLTEHRDLQNDIGLVDWGLTKSKAEPWPDRIIPMLPSEARRQFMERFNRYYNGG